MGPSPTIKPFPFLGLGLRGSLPVAGVLPTIDPEATLGFLGGRLVFSDIFLLVEGLA